MKNLILSLQEDILEGRLSFAEIATKHEVPVSWIAEVYCEMIETESFLFPEPTVQESDYIYENDYFD